jgi:hypothetical protein
MGKPFEPTKNFTKIHNALFELYTRLPDFKSDHALMYIVLMSLWNEEKGYAYPTKGDLAVRLNCNINKPKSIAEVLEKYGLIRVVKRDKSKIGSNDIYYVYAPITDPIEFYARFPEAVDYYAEQKRKLLDRNKRSTHENCESDAQIP